MNRRKIFMVWMIGALMVLCSSTALAGTWYECKILCVGAALSTANVQLGDKTTGAPLGAANNGWYGIGGTKSKEMLAAALTALSMNKTVWVILDLGVGNSLQAIYVKGN